ncbi:Metallo-beta-lactamase superfamily protein [Alkaliphilus peptidifermentans DSM 18978]|uniref:Metallo-beta-lactamase superfamily protein n=2 Tax=Alkaliphilus TaxID=114627 RepID=A0A1G5D6X4_9FIRM|nr:Metallo-beta-lactamase superfamily protein [Alkaliphilus peptidifermentans DSM 18978]
MILQDEGIILVDCGKEEHVDFIIKALYKIGKSEEDIILIIATHGHLDHVGGCRLFKNAKKIIHKDDLDLLDSELQKGFIPLLSDSGKIEGLYYITMKHHTEGSIVLYSPKYKVLFLGDFHCFFGEVVDSKGMVGEWIETRHKAYQFVKNIVTEENSYKKYKLDEYFIGLKSIYSLDIDYLCTGHGMVLTNDIKGFISSLIECKLD